MASGYYYDEDEALQRALEASFQESQRRPQPAFPDPEYDEDLQQALEASLREPQRHSRELQTLQDNLSNAERALGNQHALIDLLRREGNGTDALFAEESLPELRQIQRDLQEQIRQYRDQMCQSHYDDFF